VTIAAVALALIAITLTVYAPVRHHGFLTWDDTLYVTQNPEVLRGLTWHGVRWAFTTGYAWNWHPLTWLSHMLDVQLYGRDAGLHHLTNVLLHVANTLLLFGLLHRTTGDVARSGFVAALFGVHPLHVESVAWVAERKDVLSGLFWMLTLWAYAGYARRPSAGRYAAVLVLFALGLMSKPMVVTLPFVLLLMDVWPLRRLPAGWRLVWEKLPLLALAAAASAVTFLVQQRDGAVPGIESLPLGLRLQNAVVSYAAYVRTTLWPARLAAFYPYPASFGASRVLAAIALLVGASVLAWVFRRRGYVLVGWLWFLGTLVPVIGFVQAGNQALADRFMYVPLVGLLVVIAWGAPDVLGRWPGARLVLPFGAGLAVAASVVGARAQVEHWRDDATLWEHALVVTSGNHVAHTNVGNILMRQGRVDEAIPHYAEALRVRPAFALAHGNLGLALAAQGRLGDALDHYAEALRLDPRYAEAHYNMSLDLAKLGRNEEAIAHLEEAVRLKPEAAEPHRVLGVMLAALGRTTEAAAQFGEALRLDPGDERSRHALEELTKGP
jgi:tetratricopeptide (TPR) repeat protein